MEFLSGSIIPLPFIPNPVRSIIELNDTYTYDVIIHRIDKLQDDGTDELRKF